MRSIQKSTTSLDVVRPAGVWLLILTLVPVIEFSRDDIVRLAWWDRDENGGRCFPPWREFQHPQLGKVEIGGIDPRVGIWNPPLHELADVIERQLAVFFRVAALAPQIAIAKIERQVLAGMDHPNIAPGLKRGSDQSPDGVPSGPGGVS